MKSLVIFLATLATVYSDKFPDYIPKCSKTDPKLSKCILKSVTQAWPTIIKGDTTYHIQPLNPLQVSALNVNVADQYQSNTSNLILSGFEKAEWKEIKWNLAKRRVDMKFNIPELRFVCDYKLAGRVLGLPIEGHGDCDVAFANMDNQHHFEYNVMSKNGKEYIEIKKTEMSYTTTGIHFILNNLFNGNVPLGRAMNEVLNENWAAVNKEASVYLGNALGEVYSQVMQDFFKKVPLKDLFND